jgi:phenylalanine-4-hydroxylase
MQTTNGLRGHYESLGPDFVVPQNHQAYRPEQHDLWRKLYARQLQLLPNRACTAFRKALEKLDSKLDFSDGIPEFSRVNTLLQTATNWRLVGVPGLLPDEIFFEHLANRRFPVTVWLREPHEFDYIVEPDIFHDFFGHVPMLFDQGLADYVQAYGAGALKAASLGGLGYLARLYWYTIEYGLIIEPEGIRAYGAGILSSPGELEFATKPIAPDGHKRQWLHFDLIRMMQTQYFIDRFQSTYFAIESFAQLIEQTAPDFSLLYKALERLPVLAPDDQGPLDQVL